MKGICECCGTEEVEVSIYDQFPGKRTKLCNICASTYIGNAHQYPDQYDAALYKTLGRLANIIIKEIRRNK